MDLKMMIGRALGAEVDPEQKSDQDAPQIVPNRAMMRRVRRSHYKSVDDRRYNRPRSRTGSPDWFRSMKFMGRVKAELLKVRVADLDLPDAVIAGLAGIGYDNVWKLSQADRADLLKGHGIGPAALKKVRAALVRRSVPVAWKAE